MGFRNIFYLASTFSLLTEMKKILTIITLCLSGFSIYAQAIYKNIDSYKLDDERELKIQLPRNYDPESKRTYPLIIVLDGDYLFEPVAGNIDYQSYWEDIPDCIVVGIRQAETREDDLFYAEETNMPMREGADFYEFMGAELVPFVEENYKASNFRVIVGHDMSANFINYYLFKDVPMFRSFISLSPDLAPQMIDRLQQRLSTIEEETFYYMATGDADVKVLRESITACDSTLKAIENPKLHYKFDDFDDANHYSLVGRGIPKALNEIFSLYKPINSKEYNEKVLTFEGSPYDYLMKKYEDIEYFYGFEKKLIENDIRAIAAASKKKDDLESLENLAKLVKKEFPDSMLSAYYMGMFHEKDGNLRKALIRYKSGLLLEPSQYIDKEVMLDKIYALQEATDN